MPRGYALITGITMTWQSGVHMAVPVEHYYIQNYSPTATVALSHNGVDIHDLVDPQMTQYYSYDHQKNFYFRTLSGTADIKIVWW